ncbi:dTDP-4-amino-4,6-dideoxygalactose transaminase [Humidesulfovibrio mexicanus]|uniref:dTDP-4-amino-4,6-dideoxygalactose transaminase n=1 Tax=Humidesulfovibrio mexicanus TaxID=147047 RepID=A0A239BLY2_9BACT|nr:DegT/DnrJ/EryC1/StrS family aminotransferase [Humidesulfovibrio mexicanus]SNS08629.1 dTDP-4-amino-4,6-dideoxygalactose transaminase [Humidesulfovibrio mexicanus]
MKNAFIPFANPGAAFQARKHEYDEAFSRVIGSGQYILGPEVETFERRFAEWLADASCAAGDCIGVANGTDAIEIALRALQGLFPVPSGKLPAVFTVSHTAVATVAAIERAGCVPILVDIDEASYTMSPGSLEAAVNMVAAERPDLAPMAVIPVHLYGHPCDLDAIMGIGERHGMRIIEDCAQAHGAAYRGKRVGTLGIAGTFSFYPTKNLGAIGDAGAVYTGDSALAAEMRALRQYGWKQRYVSAIPGINSRMDPLQAAFLDINLRHLDADNAARRSIAARYDALISRATITPPVAKPEVEHAFHLYVLRSKRRDALAAFLHERGVGTAVHYPQAVHSQPAYAGRVIIAPDGLPITERVVPELLSLPMFPQLIQADVERVAHALLAWDKEQSS